MDKKQLTETDIRTKFITPALVGTSSAKWNVMTQVREEVPADLRRSILTLAVQGKLVPQDPSDEPADISLPRLARVAVEAQDDLFPRHWLRVPLGDFGE